MATVERIHRVSFDNKFGASIIRNEWGDLELAVLHHDKLCYATHITNNVITGLTWTEIGELVTAIRELSPVNHNCKSGFLR